MKRTIIRAAVISGCLLVGSLYPQMILQNHLKLFNDKGVVLETEEIDPEIPLKVRFRFLEFFKS